MSVGGLVSKVVPVSGNKLRVHTYEITNPDDREVCVCVSDTPQTRCIEPNDSFWWQCGKCYWTPKGGETVILEKCGYSFRDPDAEAFDRMFTTQPEESSNE